MPINAVRFIRKMRGGAQSHLMQCDDGHYYIVKFRNNPQHRRILVNEWIAAQILKHLQISAPKTEIVNLSAVFLTANPDVCMQLGTRVAPPDVGWHFGSRHPGDPAKMSIYDFIPDVLLEKVENLSHFRGVLVFDKWLANADSRQSVFFRARIREWSPAFAKHPNKLGFIAHMIDHGYCFDGPHWKFPDSPLHGLYFRSMVYLPVKGLDDFQPWLNQVLDFPEEVIDDALKQLPPEWAEGDEEALDNLLNLLMTRRARVPDLIRQCSSTRANPFPNWK
jgi:hypothetical protein